MRVLGIKSQRTSASTTSCMSPLRAKGVLSRKALPSPCRAYSHAVHWPCCCCSRQHGQAIPTLIVPVCAAPVAEWQTVLLAPSRPIHISRSSKTAICPPQLYPLLSFTYVRSQLLEAAAAFIMRIRSRDPVCLLFSLPFSLIHNQVTIESHGRTVAVRVTSSSSTSVTSKRMETAALEFCISTTRQ